jgi:hypothetical protein
MCIKDGIVCTKDEVTPKIGYKILQKKENGKLFSPVFTRKYPVGKWTVDSFGLKKQKEDSIEYCARYGIGFHVFATIEDVMPMFNLMVKDSYNDNDYVLMKVALRHVFAKGMNDYGYVEKTPVYLCSELKVIEQINIEGNV